MNDEQLYHVSNRFLKKKKKKKLPLKFGYLSFSVSFSIFLLAPWLSIFASAEPSQAILLMDRSEPRFESHTGVKIRKKCKKQWKFWHFFVNFQLYQIQNCSVQIKKMKDWVFSFQLKETLLPNVNRQC